MSNTCSKKCSKNRYLFVSLLIANRVFIQESLHEDLKCKQKLNHNYGDIPKGIKDKNKGK